ncbi:MAG: hypothetical protein LQ338_006495 [Usnochroma carphineum]|nr:MAG: hypothetical protein LQ338_006495 [Usnochroma carphineum]
MSMAGRQIVNQISALNTTIPYPNEGRSQHGGNKKTPSQERDDSTDQQWITQLQSTSECPDWSHRLEASNYYWSPWPRDDPDPNIPLFENNNKKYTLQISHDVLEHEEENSPGHNLFTIRWNRDAEHATKAYLYDNVDDPECYVVPVVKSLDTPETRTFSMIEDRNVLPCIFVALGWLREEETSQGRKRTTNIVVVLNITTKPASLWLMFDYHMADQIEVPIRWTNQLGHFQNHKFREPTFGSKHCDVFQPYEDRFNDKHRQFYQHHFHQLRIGTPLKQYNGEPFQNVQTALDETPHDKHNARAEATDRLKGCPALPAAQEVNDGPNSHRYSQEMPSSASDSLENTALVEANSTISSNPKGHGFFGIPEHDLVLLAPDVNAWSTQGLDQKEVKLCLDTCHMRLGPTMRAQTATTDEEEQIKEKRINIKELCFR